MLRMLAIEPSTTLGHATPVCQQINFAMNLNLGAKLTFQLTLSATQFGTEKKIVTRWLTCDSLPRGTWRLVPDNKT